MEKGGEMFKYDKLFVSILFHISTEIDIIRTNKRISPTVSASSKAFIPK